MKKFFIAVMSGAVAAMLALSLTATAAKGCPVCG